jgi:hypothetical protein
MLSRLFSLIGLTSGQTSSKTPPAASRPRSATAHLFEKRRSYPDPKAGSKPEPDDCFNPYNTGKFDRSASWERISKTQR